MVCEHLGELEAALIASGARETCRGRVWTENCREWVHPGLLAGARGFARHSGRIAASLLVTDPPGSAPRRSWRCIPDCSRETRRSVCSRLHPCAGP